MRVLKPGKIAPKGGTSARRTPEKPPQKQREVWDDFLVPKKAKKKKEYQRGDGNRMVPISGAVRSDAEATESHGRKDELGAEEQKVRSDLGTLELTLGYHFQDQSMLQRALTHRSALVAKERADYERLEFLGDAVLDLSVAHLLSDRHPEAREGELSKMRAALVNTQALADIARKFDIGPFIRLGRGELSSGGNERPSILADVMEAIIGAMYRDGGFEVTFQVIEKVLGDNLDQVTPYDPKTELQEVLHAAGSEPPTYLLELVEGPEHAPTFVTVVVVDNEIAGRGRGPTKKAAQQQAAAEALGKLIPAIAPLTLAEGQKVFLSEAMLSTNIFAVVAPS